MSDRKTTSKEDRGKTQKEDEYDDSSGGEEVGMDALRKFFADKLKLNATESHESVQILDDLSFDGLVSHWKTKGFKNIITMVGAGISTSAGIPDFRSPGSGLYDNLAKYNLPYPTAVFELDYFKENPKPFFALAKELYPGSFIPTPTHYFIKLLHNKRLLLRHYTQNIDTLDRIAGIPEYRLVEAHGTFHTNHCTECMKAFSSEWMKEKIFQDKIPICDVCHSLVKPDIVFFGESLPQRFYELPDTDFPRCDLLIIMGTSLEVQPFASLIDKAPSNCVRFLINRTMVKSKKSPFGMFGGFSRPLLCDELDNKRDVAFVGDCDDGVWALVKALGWEEELKELIEKETEHLKKKEELSKKVDQKKENSEKSKDDDSDAEDDRKFVTQQP